MHPALFAAAILAGASYLFAPSLGIAGPAVIAWKGAGVALLALWAWRTRRDAIGRSIALVLALGALGDVLLDAVSVGAGAAAFSAGHIVAILLYLRHRRPRLSGSQRALAVTLIPASAIIAWSLVRAEEGGWQAVAYASLVAAMAAAAWASAFPRYRVGVGAVLFVISDLILFARMAGHIAPGTGSVLVWGAYFAAQALIAWGVVHAKVTPRG